jgi:hypothetical protein
MVTVTEVKGFTPGPNYTLRTKHKGIAVIGNDCIDDPKLVEHRKFSFSFAWCLVCCL